MKKEPVALSIAKRRTEKKEPVALLPVVLGKIGVDGAIKKPLCSGLCCISDKRFLLKGCQFVFYDSSHLIP